ncbi:MAG: HAMP domain-containing histidine kinase [Oligoflexia bacterium]|nr:HAMP domain-containing histidine kinase [Oligoflexia bacterium]
MILKTTRSSFRSVYVTLFLLALAIILGFLTLSRNYIVPGLTSTKAESIFSIMRSHEADIILHKTRSLRDELLSSKIIKTDDDFQSYSLDEKPELKKLISNCNFISPSICIASKKAIFIEGNSSKNPIEQYKFAISLNTNLKSPPQIYIFLEIALTLVITAIFSILYLAIFKKEQLLVSRLSKASEALGEVQTLFSNNTDDDEFDSFGKSIEELVFLVKDYKEKFERKTRLEQLGLVVGQVSHDLKAPFNEAENFLKSLPNLIDEVPREDLLTAILSLTLRIQSGKRSLEQALRLTKQVNIAREELTLSEVFNSIETRVKENKKLKQISMHFNGNLNYKTLGDRIKLETAFLNLIENTADEKIDAKVDLTFSKNDLGIIKILYTDNGNSIAQENLEKIFEPLVTFKEKGTGFGLSSTREIFTQHGGRINALSYADGAKFEILLPVLGGANA